MSSIGSTLHSINTSLLSEIQSLSPAVSTGASTSAAPAAYTAKPDRLDFSQAGEVFQQLKQLQSTNPAEFKQVLTDAVKKLTDAASQQTDPKAAAFLKDLASRFQKAADTGDLSALHPQAASGAGKAHGHHHAHKAEAANDGDGDDQTGAASSSAEATSGSGSSATTGATGAESLLSLISSQTNGGAPQDLFSLLASAAGTTGNGASDSSTRIQDLLASFVTSNPASL